MSSSRVLQCAAPALAVALAACSGSRPPAANGGDGGWIDRSSPPARPAPRAPQVVERWDLAAQLAALRPAVKRSRSGHSTGELEAEVLAGSAGAYPVLGPESRMPPGATLVERLFQPEGAAPVGYLVMVKRPAGYDPSGGDWEYLAVSPDGKIEQRGILPLCARCHAEAPHDRLFGGGR
jgi:hypothetical protein